MQHWYQTLSTNAKNIFVPTKYSSHQATRSNKQLHIQYVKLQHTLQGLFVIGRIFKEMRRTNSQMVLSHILFQAQKKNRSSAGTHHAREEAHKWVSSQSSITHNNPPAITNS
jgi:hypothetical protein